MDRLRRTTRNREAGPQKMITTRKTFAIVALCLLSPCLWGGENPSPEWPGDDREKKDTVSVADTTVRRGFFRKVIDYFDDSNKNKKHKKSILTIIGGPELFRRHKIRHRTGSGRAVPGRSLGYFVPTVRRVVVRQCFDFGFLYGRHPGQYVLFPR